MRKTIIALVATVCILVAAPLAFAAAISFTVFHAVLLIGRGNWRGLKLAQNIYSTSSLDSHVFLSPD
jgi:hypothetical protein